MSTLINYYLSLKTTLIRYDTTTANQKKQKKLNQPMALFISQAKHVRFFFFQPFIVMVLWIARVTFVCEKWETPILASSAKSLFISSVVLRKAKKAMARKSRVTFVAKEVSLINELIRISNINKGLHFCPVLRCQVK